jgi:hypothetical protein
MISLPDTSFDVDDIERLADWVELSLLAGDRDLLPVTDIADVTHDSLLLDEDEAETQQQAAVDRAEAVIRSIRRRKSALGDGYPCAVESDAVLRRSGWRDNLCFTTLLVADLGRFYEAVHTDFDPASPFTRLFEKVVRASVQRVFGGTAVRFGVPREDGWPSGIVERLERLASEFGLAADSPEHKTEPHDGDFGLDVAVRLKWGDVGAGSGILLILCHWRKLAWQERGAVAG